MVDSKLECSKNSIGQLTNVIYIPNQTMSPLQSPVLQNLESYHGSKARSSISAIYSPDIQRIDSTQSDSGLPQPGKPAPPAQSIFEYKPESKPKPKESEAKKEEEVPAEDAKEERGPFNVE